MSNSLFDRAPGTLSVDIWSDVACPFCLMGDKHLADALAKFEHSDAVRVAYHSYLLMPELTDDAAMPLDEMLEANKGMPREQIRSMNEQLTARGRDSGIEYNFDKAIGTSTRSAHRLSHYALSKGLQHPLMLRLFEAYFRDGLKVSDPDVLADLAAEVGLDRAEARDVVISGAFEAEMEADIAAAQQLGISGVPFFVFNGKYAVSGAQPVETFTQVLDTAWAEIEPHDG